MAARVSSLLAVGRLGESTRAYGIIGRDGIAIAKWALVLAVYLCLSRRGSWRVAVSVSLSKRSSAGVASVLKRTPLTTAYRQNYWRFLGVFHSRMQTCVWRNIVRHAENSVLPFSARNRQLCGPR